MQRLQRQGVRVHGEPEGHGRTRSSDDEGVHVRCGGSLLRDVRMSGVDGGRAELHRDHAVVLPVRVGPGGGAGEPASGAPVAPGAVAVTYGLA